MTDLLEPAPDLEVTSNPADSPLPPPPPGGRMTERRYRVLLLFLGTVAILCVVAALVSTVGWSQSIGDRDDVIVERDAALAEADAAQGKADDTAAALIATSASLDAAETEISRLEGQLDTSRASADALADANDELTSEVDELTVVNNELIARAEELQSDLDAALAAPEEPAVFVAAEHPEFTRYVGEVLSSRFGSSRLTADQSRCYGTAVIDSVGVDGLGAGLHNAASRDANDALVGAMQAAAAECGINQALIFG